VTGDRIARGSVKGSSAMASGAVTSHAVHMVSRVDVTGATPVIGRGGLIAVRDGAGP
jgi:hypothetical protein